MVHALQLVRELQAKKHAADDKMENVHLRGARRAHSHYSNPRPETRVQLVPADPQ